MNDRIRYILTASITFCFSFLQSLADECSLDMSTPSSWNNSEDAESNWGGFLKKSSCVVPFEQYLYALAKRSNTTSGQIFLNITEQNYCLKTLNTSCGIERLTSGTGGCSDYSVTDVVIKLGNELQKLDQNCKNQGCSSCLETWDRITGEGEADICRFSVLVALTSRRINDTGWIQSIYTCLGNGSPIAYKARERKKIALGVAVGGVGSIMIVAAIVWLILFKNRTKNRAINRGSVEMDARDDGSFSGESRSGVKISLRQVQLATNNLSATNFIGQGVAGKVYKGILSDGQLVAVKHIVNDGQMETFIREVTSLSHVKHPNLVELIGHCDGEDESFLVYELCDNGNLSEWLFGKHKFLTWMQRLEIAIDCARGLWFLHTYSEGCIVHRDIKPTNILLGTNFEAKLSDFGLSKVIINAGLSYVSSEVRGTFGYVDPEYQKNRRVHPSTDVYSFGIVLLQLLSGQRVINLDVTRPMRLSKMAKNVIRGGDIKEFADKRFDGEYEVECFEMVFKLALSCTGVKQQRPTMEKVVGVLEKSHQMSQRLKPMDFSFQSNPSEEDNIIRV